LHPLKLLGIIDSIFIPIQRAVAAVRPDFVGKQLEEEAIRDAIGKCTDKL